MIKDSLCFGPCKTTIGAKQSTKQNTVITNPMLMNNYQQHNTLPVDITLEILSRSSVDSVLQCKRVCKSWRALINSPYFGHTHTDRLLLRNDQQQQNNSDSFDLFLSTRTTGHFDQYHFGKYNDEGMGAFMVKKLITPQNCPSWIPICSCNGFVCFIHRPENSYHVRIYNPLTREYVNLPKLLTSISRDNSVFTGFGYHSGTKEYKVVSIYYEDWYAFVSCSAQVSVYTLGSACKWRRKRDIHHRLRGKDCVLLNGVLHWLCSTSLVENKPRNIVSFDLADEEFRIVPSPPPCLHDFRLGVLEGCLSAGGRNSYCRPNSLDVWVMMKKNSHNNKAVQDCPWTKKYNIQWNEPIGGPSYPPLGQLKEGKILLRYNETQVVSYNPETARFGGFFPVENLQVTFPYMKSFVSLKALGEDGATIDRRLPSNNGGEKNSQQQLTRKRKR